MELDIILQNILDALEESTQTKKKLVHNIGELMDIIKEGENTRLCVKQFIVSALAEAPIENPTQFEAGYIAAAADLCEQINIARGVKEDDGRGKDADCDSETDEGQE